ncbi:amidase [Cupriavidus basilensis]|uniref:Amidase n=1 Tax=Cupriavidus basilensis TaxID=68895 RepID=A0ABT6AFV4_9BURK|nr:amidase [Cupriavidus basilensis]MDF3831475.1 amidase [Cupriavidus basilensis]
MTRQDIASTDSWQPDDACFLSVREAADLLAQGRASAQDLVNWCETAYAAAHSQVNAIVLADFAAARVAASASDLRRHRGQPLGALDGIPFSIKESFDVAGWPTTCGSPDQRNNIAASDAAVVERLRAAGAVLLGKTNVPIGLRDWQSYNAVYGTTRNPHDPTRTPGGSSGGSAAAVCAGMSFFDVGSDIGSSLRNPAHYCGVFSHKSSHGLVPLRGHGIGHGYGEQDINVAGPLARSAHDLELLLQTLAGPDGSEALAYRLALPPCNKRTLAEFRVAVLPTHPLCEADAEVSDEIESLGRWLEGQGAKVRWNVRPDFDAATLWHTYVLMLRATTSVHMDDASFGAALARAATAPAQDHDYAALQFAGAGIRHRHWLQLQQQRATFARAWQRFFDDYDVLLCPAAATTAFVLDEEGEPWQRRLVVNGREQPLTSQLFWAGHSGLCGLPSTVAPIGPGRGGLPVGVQIVAGRFADLTSLRFAQLLEAAGFAFRRPPVSSLTVQRAPAQ